MNSWNRKPILQHVNQAMLYSLALGIFMPRRPKSFPVPGLSGALYLIPMNKMPWFKFFPADWIKGTLRLSVTERGAWINLLCHMWESDNRGEIVADWQELGRIMGVDYLDAEPLILGLVRKGILEMSGQCPVNVRLMSRRMSRECHAKEEGRKRKQKQRVSDAFRKKEKRHASCHANVTDKKSVVRSQSIPVVPFLDFYKLYPKKQARAEAEKAWEMAFREAIITKQSWDGVVRPALLAQSASDSWMKENGQYVPLPATWLRRRRWEDELVQPQGPKSFESAALDEIQRKLRERQELTK